MSLITTVTGALGGIPNVNLIGGAESTVASTVSGIAVRTFASAVLDATRTALQLVASAIGTATAPNLESTWFSSAYWRVAALAAMLTIPFLCAASLQALARADMGLIARVVFGYLPLSVLGVSLAAPLTTLLLAATDQMSSAVSASAAEGGARFLDHAAAAAAALSTVDGSPFLAVVLGLFVIMAALMLAVELLMRAAAVYVVVLMLPLAFAAFVWPARRVWAVRLVELLVSLILSKFVIVAVLSLAGAAFSTGDPGISQLLTAMALLMLSTFAPWTLMRILPFTELAAGAAGVLSGELRNGHRQVLERSGQASEIGNLAMDLPARMRSQAQQLYAGSGGGDRSAPPAQSEEAETGVPDAADATPVPTPAPAPGTTVPPAATTTVPPAPTTTAPPAPGNGAGGEPGEPPYAMPDLSRDGRGVYLDADLIRNAARQSDAKDPQ